MACKDCDNLRFNSEETWWTRSKCYSCEERDGKSIKLDDDNCHAFHQIESHQELTGEYCKKCGKPLRKCDIGSDFHSDGQCFGCRENNAKQQLDIELDAKELIEDEEEKDCES